MNKSNETLSLIGIYAITKAKIETTEQKNLHDKIVLMQKQIIHPKEAKSVNKLIKESIDKLNSICKIEKMVFTNIIPTVGRTLLANNLTAVSPTNDPLANYIALGTGTTAVANGDTTLQTEVYRNTVASRTNANNVAYITGFFSATEDADTYYEAGIFCNGTSSANSGVLLSHVLLNAPTGITKSASESLTVDWTLSIT